MSTMLSKLVFWPMVLVGVTACGGGSDLQPVVPTNIEPASGNGQSGVVGAPLADPLSVRASDAAGNAASGVTVTWLVLEGGGAISPGASTTNSDGVASAEFTLGMAEGQQRAEAEVSGLAGSPVVFTAHGFIQPLVPAVIEAVGGNVQNAAPGEPLPDSLSARVSDAGGAAVPGVTVNWSVLTGGGSVSPTSTTTNSSGTASTQFTLGPTEGEQQVQAEVSGLSGSPLVFTAMATPGVVLSVAAGGYNVPERYSSDLWVHGDYAYTGTWGGYSRNHHDGDVLKIWSLNDGGAPTLVDSIKINGIVTVSDVQVSDDGQLLIFSTEFGSGAGLYLYSLANPAEPAFLSRTLISSGFHTVTLSKIGGRQYAFAAHSPGAPPALDIFDVTDPSNISLATTIPVPPNYGVHDSFVRDGLAFVFAWNTGVIIYDVGNGMRGGSPTSPVEVSRLVTAEISVSTPAVHNGWWFHNPVTGERRYLFIGQEGPNFIGSESSGDIHVVDVSDLAHPREVASFHLKGAGTHNFWMDEARQVLYAAYYNAGVIALDVSGTLSGDLSNRLLSQVLPGGTRNTFTWGVQLANGSLYAIDMLSGLWQLKTE